MAARVQGGRAQRRPDRARLDLGRDVGDLVIAERLVQQHLVRRRVRQRVAGHVVRVAVGLAAVPEGLDQGQDQRPLELVRVVRVEDRAYWSKSTLRRSSVE